LSGKTVRDSFSIAKEALKSSPYVPHSHLEGAKFVLLPDHAALTAKAEAAAGSGAGGAVDINPEAIANYHNTVLFRCKPVVDWPLPGKHCTMGPNLVDVKTFISNYRLPSPPADFEGREVVMHNVIRNVMNRRLVSLTGEDGVGKTAVAAAICKYLADREAFQDSIVYVKSKGMKTYRAFLKNLESALLSSGCESIVKRLQTQRMYAATAGAGNLVYPEEEIVLNTLQPLRMLLVLDHLDELVTDYGESHTDFRIFMNSLFESCPYVKVLVVSTDTLSMHNITFGFGVVEYGILLGPLTLHSTLRLFARLAPALSTTHARKDFISALQPARQLHVSVNSRDVNKTALQILSLFGDGHPAKIVHMACESTAATVDSLRHTGMEIIQHSAQWAAHQQQHGAGQGHGAGGTSGGGGEYVSSSASVGGQSVISMASYTSAVTHGGASHVSYSTNYSTYDNNNHR
jgi:hypothetical protein